MKRVRVTKKYSLTFRDGRNEVTIFVTEDEWRKASVNVFPKIEARGNWRFVRGWDGPMVATRSGWRHVAMGDYWTSTTEPNVDYWVGRDGIPIWYDTQGVKPTEYADGTIRTADPKGAGFTHMAIVDGEEITR